MAAIIALVLGVSSMLGLDAQPRTLYVAPSGSDRNDCLTPQTACAGFDAGYHAAAPGDVVEVQAGSYPPQLFSPDASKTSPDDVIVRPAPGARVIVGCDGPDNCLATEGADHLTVERIETAYLEPVPDVPSSDGPALRQGGVALDRGSEDVTFRDLDAGHLWFAAGDSRVIGGDYGPTVDEDSKIAGGDGANQLIDGAYFHDHLLKAAHMQCIWLAGAQGVTIRRSRFDNCAVFSIFSTPEVGQHYKDVLIENNFFSNSGDVSMSTHVKVGSHGGDCTNFVMRNNTFVDENVISDCGADAGTATNIRWIGNIFESGGCGAPGHVFDYNVMENGSPCGPHDRKVDDVRFVDRAAQDLHLAAGSPAIGAGHPTDHPADDIDGDPRPSGVASDAGADAYVAGGGGASLDRIAPGLRLRVAKRVKLRGRRLVFRVECYEPCRLKATLQAKRPAARRLGLGRRAVVVGSGGSRRLVSGSRRMVARVKPKPFQGLRGTGRVRMTLRVTATDAAGNSRTVARRLAVKR